MYYWNNWYSGWGWFLWYGVFMLIFLSFGNFGYTYRAHRKFDARATKDAFDFLNERYARGEIKQHEYFQIKAHLVSESEERRLRNNITLSGSSLQPSY